MNNVKKVAELQQENAALRKRIQELEAEITVLKAMQRDK